jgi:hypothetical protein
MLCPPLIRILEGFSCTTTAFYLLLVIARPNRLLPDHSRLVSIFLSHPLHLLIPIIFSSSLHISLSDLICPL